MSSAYHKLLDLLVSFTNRRLCGQLPKQLSAWLTMRVVAIFALLTSQVANRLTFLFLVYQLNRVTQVIEIYARCLLLTKLIVALVNLPEFSEPRR